jgi:hypothetical protein
LSNVADDVLDDDVELAILAFGRAASEERVDERRVLARRHGLPLQQLASGSEGTSLISIYASAASNIKSRV